MIERIQRAVEEAHLLTFEGDTIGIRRELSEARAVLAALDDEPSLEDVLRDARWIAYMDVSWNEDGGYDAEISGYVSEDGFRGGEGTGLTIAEAIHEALIDAQEDDDG